MSRNAGTSICIQRRQSDAYKFETARRDLCILTAGERPSSELKELGIKRPGASPDLFGSYMEALRTEK